MTLIEQLQYFKENAYRVQEYFQHRGISSRIQQEFELGFCPENCPREAYQFRGRVMVPINNIQGDLVAFGGRTLGNDHPKYINSAESDIYKKSRLLYNLDKAQDYILSDGRALVVEGYFDVMGLWEAGIKNVVASCGTSLTKYQIRLLKRFADEIVVCYDSDKAGSAAAERVVEGLSDEMIALRYVSLPDGLDPDDFLKKYSSKDFLDIISV